MLLQGAFLFGQHNTIPLQWDIYFDLDKNHSRFVSLKHTAFRPYTEESSDLNNVIGHRVDSAKHYYWVTQKLFKENLVIIHTDELKMTIDPVFDLSMGADLFDDSDFKSAGLFGHNTRGLRIAGDLGKKLSFQTSFYENQGYFPQYIYFFTTSTGVIPGQGRAKKFNGRSFDYGWASGSISYSPIRQLNIQFGTDKNFIGNGYRSMLLSDAGFNYPHLKISYLADDHRLQYHTVMARLQSLDRLPTGDTPESLFRWKGGTFNFLSYIINERVHVGLFEGIIWQVMDEDGMVPYNYMRINPVIGVNTLVYGFDDANNVVLGLDLKIKMTDKTFVYGQFAMDDPTNKKFAYQIGVKAFDVLIPNLFLQVEYNKALPYTFASELALQNYSHYAQPIGHPYGAYFDEVVTIAQYRVKKWTFKWKMNLAKRHSDKGDNNYGGNIFNPDDGTRPSGDPVEQNLMYHDVSAGFLMNQMTNMNLTAGMWLRDLSNAPDEVQTLFVYVAWRTSLFNKYYDF